MGTIFTRRFEADRIGSQVPIKFMHLEGLYELFVSKFAYCMSDHSMHLFRVHLLMKLTYQHFQMMRTITMISKRLIPKMPNLKQVQAMIIPIVSIGMMIALGI